MGVDSEEGMKECLLCDECESVSHVLFSIIIVSGTFS